MKKVSLTIPFEKNEAVVFPTLPSFSTKSLHHFSREMNSPPLESSETQQSTSYSAFLLKKNRSKTKCYFKHRIDRKLCSLPTPSRNYEMKTLKKARKNG